MRRWVATAAAGLLFVGLLAVWAVWVRPQGSREAASATVLSVDPGSVQALTVEQGGGVTMEIRREGQGWRFERPRRVAASGEAVDSLLQSLAPLPARRLIASGGQEGGADPAAFGLAPPRAVLTLELADGSKRRLLIGSETPVSQGMPAYYARVEGSDAIYTIDAYIAEQITGSWEDFRDRRVVPFAAQDVHTVRVQVGGVTVQARRDPEASAAERRWRLVEPYDAPGDAEAIERVLRDLEFARVSRFVSDEPSPQELARYGLAAPQAVVEVTYAPAAGGQGGGGSGGGEAQRATLLVGGEAEGGGRYVKRADSPSVYTVPQSDVASVLGVQADAWVRRRILGLARGEIRRVSFSMEGRPGPVTLALDAGGQWSVSPGQRRPEAGEVQAWLDALWSLQAEQVVAVGRSARPPERTTDARAIVMEVTVAGYDGVPVTRLVIPVPVEAAGREGGGQESPRTVYVEQGEDRLLYRVPAEALKEIEGFVAKWTAPESGAASSPSASR